ncbi:ribonuclease R [Desulfonatronospira thiodismutans ASO3-1]|uniref:Ribonuclease R n=1 Tax=Desulfonatronospira thiodismutans ASO3-1 TaxID=555779 RepID=D6STL3_9BACT|nr:ribonuclease R [Desulfonatronospira thiodismutans]EFI34029.1 ribonuclease R [Desulfonatronospira thiodismutans ASO3-1]
MSKKLDQKKVLKHFKAMNKPLSIREIRDGLGVDKKEVSRLKDILRNLQKEGRIFKARKTYCLVDELPVVKAVLEVQRSGVGFAVPFDQRRRDIFIHPKNFGEAWHGDTVLVSVLPGGRGKNQEGRVVRIVERGIKQLPAKVIKKMKAGMYLARPADPKLDFSFILEDEGGELGPGVMVLVEPGEQMESRLWSADIQNVLGPEDDLAVQEQVVKENHQVPVKFPKGVLKEAASLPSEPAPEDIQKRKDLTDLPFVTIDGAQAKDFDDAVLVEKKGDGYVLYVAIADVSHYVQPGSRMDVEALDRGNSYYFPLSVEPMFPENLSNGLCSLNPGVPRLVMTAQMHFSSQGVREKASFYPAVIKSHHRLTYSQVNSALYLEDKKVREEIAPVLSGLETADELARKLLARREKRGSIEFDLPEPEVLQNLREGTLEIIAKSRNFAHQIIEECMLAANEAVAEFLEEKEALFLYRIHPPADRDKLDALFKLLATTELGPRLPKEREPKSLQTLLEIAKDSDLDFLVNRLVLRSMMQAKYSPVNEGHFGLASRCYCHFTSPIRRYADLVVHRALKRELGMDVQFKARMKSLKKTGESLSSLERKAVDAEREILKRATIISLKDKTGQSFSGIVASITDFGFWVELTDIMAEGMVRLSSLSDDYYVFRQEKQDLLGRRTGKRFYLGQKVQVVLQSVSLERLEVDLVLDES